MKSSIAALVLGIAMVSPALAADLKSELLAMERASWKAWGDHDVKVYTDSMTDNAVQISSEGELVRGRDDITALVRSHHCTLSSVDLSDVDVRQPTPDTAILTYVATQDMRCDGEKSPPKVFSTAVYVRQGGKWLWTHYQESPIE